MRQKHHCPNCRAKRVALNTDTLVFTCDNCRSEYPANSYTLALLLAVKDKAAPTNKLLVLVTRDAYASLTDKARDYGYVRSTQPRGLHNFIAELSTLDYTDNRPEHIRATDQWHPGIQNPVAHMMRVTSDTRARMAAIAHEHGIAPFKAQAPVLDGLARLVNVGPLTYSQTAYIGPTLEAIGHGWLSSTTQPRHAPDDYWQNPKRTSRNETLRY